MCLINANLIAGEWGETVLKQQSYLEFFKALQHKAYRQKIPFLCWKFFIIYFRLKGILQSLTLSGLEWLKQKQKAEILKMKVLLVVMLCAVALTDGNVEMLENEDKQM